MSTAPTEHDIMMSETMQMIGMFAKNWPLKASDKDELRTATLTMAMDVVRGIDTGNIQFSDSICRGELIGLLVCVFETLFDGKFGDRIQVVEQRTQ